MQDKRIEPYELVQISTGKRVMPPYMNTSSYYDGHRAVLVEGLKKDGTPSMGTGAGRIWVKGLGSHWMNLWDFVRYDEAKEAQAEPIRAEVAELRAALEEAEARLLSLYSAPQK